MRPFDWPDSEVGSNGEPPTVMLNPERAPGPVGQSSPRDGHTRFEQIGVLESMSWYRWTVIACVAVFTLAGIALGLLRTPDYTATATMNVDFAAQSPTTLQGSMSAAQASAESYARAFDNTQLVDKIAAQTGLAPDTIRSRVTAASVPENTVVTLDARGGSEASAVELANVSSAGLIGYVKNFAHIGRANADLESATLLKRYREISGDYNRSLALQGRLEHQLKANPTPAARSALHRAKVRVQVADLKRQGLFEVYTGSQRSYVAPLAYLSQATNASSDRLPKLELFVFLGLLAGLAVGAAAATMRANSISFLS
jgi:hypothetical protein